jgi:hypothetical protein
MRVLEITKLTIELPLIVCSSYSGWVSDFLLRESQHPSVHENKDNSDFNMTLDYLIFYYIEHFLKCDANSKMMTPAKAHMPFPPHLQWSGTDTPQQKVYHDIILKKTSQVEDQHQNGRTLATYWGRCKLPEYF